MKLKRIKAKCPICHHALMQDKYGKFCSQSLHNGSIGCEYYCDTQGNHVFAEMKTEFNINHINYHYKFSNGYLYASIYPISSDPIHFTFPCRSLITFGKIINSGRVKKLLLFI